MSPSRTSSKLRPQIISCWVSHQCRRPHKKTISSQFLSHTSNETSDSSNMVRFLNIQALEILLLWFSNYQPCPKLSFNSHLPSFSCLPTIIYVSWSNTVSDYSTEIHQSARAPPGPRAGTTHQSRNENCIRYLPA